MITVELNDMQARLLLSALNSYCYKECGAFGCPEGCNAAKLRNLLEDYIYFSDEID